MTHPSYLLLILPWLLLPGCSPNQEKPSAARPSVNAETPAPPVVRVDSKNLLYRYKDKDGWHQALSASEVPVACRAKVQVIDLGQAPATRNSTQYIHLFDLTQPSPDGAYTGTTIPRKDLESSMRTEDEPTQADPVIMYSTSWCGVCKKAARFMAKNGIAFVEKDVEKDKSAARELMEARRKHGIQGNGVPVFDIGGQVMSGFDPNRLKALVGRRP